MTTTPTTPTTALASASPPSVSAGALPPAGGLEVPPMPEVAAGDEGQATTEYALVLLGAALVALLLVAWATAGGGGGRIGRLFDAVLDAIIGKI